MNGRKKPRLPRWPACNGTISRAILNASRLTPTEVAAVLQPLEAGVTAMRQGQGTMTDWSAIASACTIALTIEEQGVVRGLRGHLQATDAALQAIAQRCDTNAGWQRTALYFHEIDALSDLVFLHRHQLEALSAAEFHRAVDLATARVRQAEARGRVLEAA